MTTGLYITHPEIVIDPLVPVPNWRLSEKGLVRAQDFSRNRHLPTGPLVYSSPETKAIELAGFITKARGGEIRVHPEMGENDRSATGFLEPGQFEQQVELLFAHPDRSTNGWETATKAQRRIVAAVTGVFHSAANEETLLFTGHGCVGTLLKCHIAGRPIARKEDQREVADPGGGNFFAFTLAPATLLCDWTPIENFRGLAHYGRI